MCCVESIPPWAVNQKILPGPNRVTQGYSRDRLIRNQDREHKISTLASIPRPAKFETKTGKNDVIIGVFDFLKKILGLQFAHKLVL